MLQKMLMLVPQEAYATLLVVAGLMMILGLRKLAMGLAGAILLFAMFGPFVDAMIEAMPPWLFAFLCLVSVLSFIRVIIGKGVSDNLFAMLLYDLIRAPFRFLGWVLRGFAPRRRT